VDAEPKRAKDFEKGEGVLAVAEAGFHAPAGMLDAGVVLFRFCSLGLLACELVADGDGEGAGVEVFHAKAHGGFVKQLVGDGPGAFGRAVFGARTWEWPRDFCMSPGTGAPSSPVAAPRNQ